MAKFDPVRSFTAVSGMARVIAEILAHRERLRRECAKSVIGGPLISLGLRLTLSVRTPREASYQLIKLR
jgi:hypothetical protein